MTESNPDTGPQDDERTDRWWITTDLFSLGGETFMGPFESRDLALAVRYYVEKVERPRTFAVDQALEDTREGRR